MESIKNLIEGDKYRSLLEYVQKETSIPINQRDLPSALLAIDAKSLRAAKTDVQVIEHILETDLDEIRKYAISRIYSVKDDGQEYPEGEEPDDDDEDEVIESLPYYKKYLVGIIIEYYLLKQKPAELEKYLKALRIPHAKKFEKELKEIYCNL